METNYIQKEAEHKKVTDSEKQEVNTSSPRS